MKTSKLENNSMDDVSQVAQRLVTARYGRKAKKS